MFTIELQDCKLFTLDETETDVLLEVFEPIFQANSSANDTISAFQGLFEAASIDGFVCGLSG